MTRNTAENEPRLVRHVFDETVYTRITTRSYAVENTPGPCPLTTPPPSDRVELPVRMPIKPLLNNTVSVRTCNRRPSAQVRTTTGAAFRVKHNGEGRIREKNALRDVSGPVRSPHRVVACRTKRVHVCSEKHYRSRPSPVRFPHVD